jgi:S1-C subfamily serine protease
MCRAVLTHCCCWPCCFAGAADNNLHSVGLLVVDSTVPGSPADGVLEPGDVLVRVQGEVVSHFLQVCWLV